MTELIDFYKTLTKEQKAKINKLYHDWVSYQPCCICNSGNVGSPHHVRLPGWCGTGMKPPDVFCIPIQEDYHRQIHTKGQKTFQNDNKVDFIDILTGLHDLFSRLYDLQKIVGKP